MKILLFVLISIVLVGCANCKCAINKEWQLEPREIQNGI